MNPPSNLRFIDTINQNLLLHPFIVLRRTCQVNRKCSPFICLQPFSLIPFVFHQQQKQGLFSLYKGLTSELLVKGITLGSETAIANYLEWPREVTKSKTVVEDSLKILLLRGLSITLTTPFLCSAVIETVQSAIILSDRPSFVDCLRDGLVRLTHVRNSPSSRILPIWMLVLPTVFYHLSHTVLIHTIGKSINWIKRNLNNDSSIRKRFRSSRSRIGQTQRYDSYASFSDSLTNHDQSIISLNDREPTNSKCDLSSSASTMDNLERDSNLISTSILASLIADVVLLPVETTLNSIYIQGTRTIIDNCDETTVVLPVLTNYDSFLDCLQSIMRFEGKVGLFKGLGAILLQYSIHYLLFKTSYIIMKKIQKHADEVPRRRSSRNNHQQLL